MEEQPIFLTAESPLQPHVVCIFETGSHPIITKWPGTYCIAWIDLKFMAILLPQSPKALGVEM